MTPEERADILVKAWNSTQTARLNEKAIKSLIETMSAGMNAAHIEGLRERQNQLITLWHFSTCPFDDCERCIRDEPIIKALRDEIAALERGKG